LPVFAGIWTLFSEKCPNFGKSGAIKGVFTGKLSSKFTGKQLGIDHILVYIIINWTFTWSKIVGGLTQWLRKPGSFYENGL